MVTAFALMNVLEDFDPFFLAYATLEDARDATLVELVVNDSVRTGSTLDLPSGQFILEELVVGEVGEEGLRP